MCAESTARVCPEPRTDCIHYTVAGWAGDQPDAAALLDTDGAVLDYAGLSRRISETVAALRGWGLGPGDRVATLLPPGMDTAAALVAVSAGTVCTPLDPASTPVGLDAYLSDLRPGALLVPEGDASRVLASARSRSILVIQLNAGTGGELTLIDGAPREPLPVSGSRAGDIALLLHTSGTVAAPKLVPVTHRMLAASAGNIADALELSELDRLLSVMPLHHIHGLSTLCAAIRSGGSVCCTAGFDADRFPDWLDSDAPTWYSAAPAMHWAVVRSFRAHGREPSSALRFVRSASAPLPVKLAAELEALFRVPVIESYGMTEATAQITSNLLPPHVRKPGSAGRAMGPEVAIMDEAGRRLSAGETGEIVIRGDNVIKEYWRRGGDEECFFHPDWFRTGDSGYLDAEGHLFITGRLKDIINRGGEKILPGRVDRVLMQHPAVADAASYPVAHPTLGEEVAAAVVIDSEWPRAAGSDHGSLVRDLKEFAAECLAHFQVPRRITLVEEIPAEASGKVDRRALAAATPAKSAPCEAPPPEEAPTTLAERKLLEVFASVLGSGPIGVHDDFFMAGGDSLSASQVVARLSQVFPVALTEGDLFDHATASGLAGLLGRRMLDRALEPERAAGGGRIPRRGGAGPFPVSFSQQRMWILDQLGGASAYNVSAALHITGMLDEAVLARSISELCRRHDTLRTVFRFRDDRLEQEPAADGPVHLPFVDLSGTRGAPMTEALRLARSELDRRFELEAGPPYRAMLLRLARDEHLLVLVLHHIVADGWSRNVLHRDLAAIYAAVKVERPPLLPVLPIRYADYAAWERDRLAAGELDGQLDYWKHKLAGAASLNGFPPDHPRPAAQSYRGACHAHRLEGSLLERLKTLGRDHDATLFMTLLAAFQALMFRYTFEPDCLVGTPVAGRAALETEDLIGCFANTLVLRTDLSGDPTFHELLARVRVVAREAYANQELPFDRLVEALHPDRDLSRMPLFQVMFALQDMPNGGADTVFSMGEDVTARPVPLESARAKFDLTVYLSQSAEGLDIAWQYSSDLFQAGTIERLGRHYGELLAGIAADAGRRISDFPLPLDGARDLPRGADTAFPVPGHGRGGFAGLFEARAREIPDAVAVTAGDEELSYREVNERAERLAERLRRLGVGAGSVTALVLPRSAAFIWSLLGVWKAGGACLLCDPSYPAQRIAYMLADVRASFVITRDGPLSDPVLAAAVRAPGDACAPVVVNLDDPETRAAAARDGPGRTPGAGDLAYIVYTSGSAGRPKGVMIEHDNVAQYAGGLRDALGVTAGDRWLHTASFGFSSAIRQLVVPLGCGATVVLADEATVRDPLALFELARDRRATIMDVVPSYLRACVRVLGALRPTERAGLLDNNLRLVLSASEPLSTVLARDWLTVAGRRARLVNMYGQTETTGIVATHPVDVDDDPPGCGTLVPVGRPVPGTRLYLLDAQRRPVPDGARGEVYVGGPGVGRGYVNLAELTAERFVADWIQPRTGARLYRTGDMARRLADGRIELLGRADDQVKVRGFRVEPQEIEAVLREHPAVSEAAVLMAPAPSRDARDVAETGRLAACVVLHDKARAQGAPALREHLANRLPVYMMPASIVVLDALPRLHSGKLDRVVLAGLVRAGGDRGAAPAAGAPRTGTERRMAEIWQRVLGVDRVGIEDNFFDLGGDSLLSVQVVLAATQAGMPVTLAALFRNRTLWALARDVDARAAEAGEVVDTGADRGAREPEATPSGMAGDTVWVDLESLRSWGREALTRAGLEPEGAGIVTEVQLEASLRGQSTHNMVSIPRYARRIASGVMNASPAIAVEHDTPLSAAIDGDNGPGQWVSVMAVETAIRKARQHGVGMVTVRRSNHFGAAGHYAWLAARQGLIGICTTNGPVILAPTGGVTPTFGNNPLAVGVPAGQHPPVLLDATMSVAPRGKIGLALSEGRQLAPGWILDRFGRPSTDPADLVAGLGVPIGGHKGYGLALVMEILAGVLSGSGFCRDHRRELLRQNAGPPDTGHFFLVIDPALTMSAGTFAARVDHMIEQVKSGERADGVQEILVPGEAELKSRARHLERGEAPLRASTYDALLRYGKEAGINTSLAVRLPAESKLRD